MLALLQEIRSDVAHLHADMVEINERLGLIDAQYASLSRRVDWIAGDVERIKRRFDIVDAKAW